MPDDPQGARDAQVETDDDLHRRADRGGRAQRLLNDPMLREAFDAMRAEHTAAYKQIPPNDVDGLLIHRLYDHVIDRFEQNLTDYVQDGKMATFDLAQRSARRQAAQDRAARPEPIYAYNDPKFRVRAPNAQQNP